MNNTTLGWSVPGLAIVSYKLSSATGSLGKYLWLPLSNKNSSNPKLVTLGYDIDFLLLVYDKSFQEQRSITQKDFFCHSAFYAIMFIPFTC